jgi:hypothetical protein
VSTRGQSGIHRLSSCETVFMVNKGHSYLWAISTELPGEVSFYAARQAE